LSPPPPPPPISRKPPTRGKRKPTWLPVPSRRLPQIIDDKAYGVHFECGIRLVSEGNEREHWRARHARKSSQRAAMGLALAALASWRWNTNADLEITITRIAPKAFDRGDNCEGSAKQVKDEIAAWLGVDDNDKRLTWVIRQERAGVREYGCRVQIREVSQASRIADLRAQLEAAEAAMVAEKVAS
jgi:hypothetical protein